MSASTQVYVNWGRLVADCGADGCSDARTVDPGQRMMTCVAGHLSELFADDSLPQVMTALSERAAERHRNWFPREHPIALRTGQPHGQSIADLHAEHSANIAGGN